MCTWKERYLVGWLLAATLFRASSLLAQLPDLTVNPRTLTFHFETGGKAPAPQTVSVGSTGSQLSYTVTTSTTSGGSWLSATPTSGITPGTETVSVKVTGLAKGVYTGSVIIASSGAGNSPRTVAVTLLIDQYRLMGWSELGMHCIDGKDYSIWSVLPPYNVIRAQLVTLTDPPVPVTTGATGVTITYQALADSSGSINTISSTKTNFWSPLGSGGNAYNYLLFPNLIPDHLGILGGSPVISRVNPPKDIGLTNDPVQSLTPHMLQYNSSLGNWEATAVPTVPYDNTGAFKPYPMVQLTAKNSSGTVLATAQIVLSVSDELRCSTCHASGSDLAAKPNAGWVNDPDPNKDMKLNVLRKHDDKHPITSYLSELAGMGYHYQSTLEATARGGTPVLCAACHSQNALELSGLSGINSMTQDMHLLHGTQINPNTGHSLDSESVNSPTPDTSCYLCHPGVTTRCERGAMSNMSSTANSCFSCHGNLAGTAGNKGPYVGLSTRVGWLTLPACQMCHQNSLRYTTTLDSNTGQWRTSTDLHFATQPNVPLTGFSLYRYSQEQFSGNHGTINCSACHGSPHAEFPTTQANDNVYSTQLQGYAGVIRECNTCHNPVPRTRTGGPHGMHTVGQSWVNSHETDNTTQCQYCHGADYRGTFLSQLKVQKTFNADDFGTKTFPAGHMISCYDCHNGPGGG